MRGKMAISIELKLKLEEVEAYLQNEFPGKDVKKDENQNGGQPKEDPNNKSYYSFSIGAGIDSSNVAFYKDFFNANFPGKIKLKLERLSVAAEMKQAGPYQTILVRSRRVEVYPTRGFLPKA